MILSYQRICSFIRGLKLNKKIMGGVLMSAILPIYLMPSLSTPVVSEAKNEVAPVSIDLSSAKIFAAKQSAVIVPGESRVDREAREKAEADAKAKADAAAKSKSRNIVAREYRAYNDPSDFDMIYLRAQNTYGVNALILKAVHTVETGRSGSTGLTNHSGSGAQGPMQFLPSTWRRHGVDGNGDGIADINNVEDAIFSAAAYLKACGYPDVKKALWGYNPSTSYFNKVMGIARSFGY